MMEIQFLPSGDMAITVEFGKEISLDTNKKKCGCFITI